MFPSWLVTVFRLGALVVGLFLFFAGCLVACIFTSHILRFGGSEFTVLGLAGYGYISIGMGIYILREATR